MGRRFPISKPTPFAADDVHERVSYRTKAATQVTSELLRPESSNSLQDPVVCPTVVLVEQLNVVLSHGERGCPLSRESYPASVLGETETRHIGASWVIGPNDRQACRGRDDHR